jgi:hypothetical protein
MAEYETPSNSVELQSFVHEGFHDKLTGKNHRDKFLSLNWATVFFSRERHRVIFFGI